MHHISDLIGTPLEALLPWIPLPKAPSPACFVALVVISIIPSLRGVAMEMCPLEFVDVERMFRDLQLGNVHYRDGRDLRFADTGDIAERVAFCRYN